jgi:hypothetical protein
MSATYPRLDDNTIVYRALTRGGDINKLTGDATPDGFIRRPKGDEDGLSVSFTEEVEVTYKGLVTLTVGQIRAFEGLDVIQDEPNHAYIVGLPLKTESMERAGKAEYLGGELARRAAPVRRRAP